MTNTTPPRRRPKSIVLKSGYQPRVYRTYEDWLATQKLDTRTPNERGIHVGSPVMWRHKHNGIIISDRVTVLAITDNTLTVSVKDVKERTCKIHVDEVAGEEDRRLSMWGTSERNLATDTATIVDPSSAPKASVVSGAPVAPVELPKA